MQNIGGKLRVGDLKGTLTEVDPAEVEEMRASSVSTMPEGLPKQLGDDRLVGDVHVEDTDIARKRVHSGDKLFGQVSLVIGNIPSDQLDDMLGLVREQLVSHVQCSCWVIAELPVCRGDGANGRNNPIMGGLVKPLSNKDIADLAAYLHSLPGNMVVKR